MWVSLELLKFTIYFVGSGGQLYRVVDLIPLSYLEHCITKTMQPVAGVGKLS